MSKLPSIGPKHAADVEFDIEQPRPPAASTEPSFDLEDRMPQLTDPKVIAAMRSAVFEVSQARSVLKTLGERPDHEAVDTAKSKLAEIESKLSKQLEGIVLSPRPAEVERLEWRSHLAEKEKESRDAAEKQRQMYRAVISVDEMHEAYEKMLKDAEAKLARIYEAAVTGRGVEASGKGIERIDLSGRRLRLLPEAFGRLRGLVVLNLSSNQLEAPTVKPNCSSQQAIPDSIGGLENLEELNLASNLLDFLPDSIGLLLNLKLLDVSSNKLVALPDSICHCRSLVELDVSFNRLAYLPTNIGPLHVLDVHFNELRGLPLGIGRLTNLEILNLSSNFSDLTELPATIGDLTNLKELDISNNQIHALPDTFGRLDNLTKLNLEENPLCYSAKGERKSMLEVKEQTQTGWLTRSTSWLSNVVSGVSGTVYGYMENVTKSPTDPYLNQQL
ncbi:plant intracellular ras group-related LRR 1 [Actinidia rufa]|uniref:Plant intracellular ras group-related LRR 1 n=1 Tax=Actinidia rufa TaxID=165716 RepID=A0A7J0GMH7_9ERIC|nr:plant intracellular ras group-related LRR 1 [Actinidia rufa]